MFGYNNSIVQEDLERIYLSRNSWSRFEDKKVFITGANAMLGTYVAYFFLYLAEQKCINVQTVVLTRTESKSRVLYKDFLNKPFFKMVCQDVTFPISYNGETDFIFHFAGNASPKYINSDPVGILKSNLIGMFNVMELAKCSKPECVMFASTREVYGAMDATTLSEDSFGRLDPMENRSCYPESKRAGESILRSYFLQYGVKGISVRIAHSYGPGMKIDSDGRVMADFISDAVNYRNIVLKSTGDAVRAFCYVSDAVQGMLQIVLDGKPGEAYNLANEKEPYSIRDVAEMICQSFSERKIHVEYACEQPKVGYCNYPRVALDTSKVEALGFSPKVSLEEGIRRTVKSFD